MKYRRLRFAGHCVRNKDELASEKLAEDINCRPEDLKNLMNDREAWKERVMACRTSSTW